MVIGHGEGHLESLFRNVVRCIHVAQECEGLALVPEQIKFVTLFYIFNLVSSVFALC